MKHSELREGSDGGKIIKKKKHFSLSHLKCSHCFTLEINYKPPPSSLIKFPFPTIFNASHDGKYNQEGCLHYFVQHKLLHQWLRQSTDGTWTLFHRLFHTKEPNTSGMQREASLH